MIMVVVVAVNTTPTQTMHTNSTDTIDMSIYLAPVEPLKRMKPRKKNDAAQTCDTPEGDGRELDGMG